MSVDCYTYRFLPDVDMVHVQDVLVMATMAAEGLHGRSRIQLEAGFNCHPEKRTVEVEAGTEVGGTVARVFTALLATVIGEAAFKVARCIKDEYA